MLIFKENLKHITISLYATMNEYLRAYYLTCMHKTRKISLYHNAFLWINLGFRRKKKCWGLNLGISGMHLELEESKLLNKKSMGCGSRICLSKTFISSTGHRQHEAPNKSPENWMNRRDTGEKEAGDPLLFPAEQRWMAKRCCRKKPPRNFTLLSQCFLHFVEEKPDCFMVQYSKSREVAQNCAINQVNSQHPFSPASNPVKTISINTSNVYINKTNANHNQRGFWSVIVWLKV